MGRRSKQAFLQRRHTNGQKAHKMLNTANYKRNADQNYSEVPIPITSHQSEWPSSKSLQIIGAFWWSSG